jgi:hypothetical protein
MAAAAGAIAHKPPAHALDALTFPNNTRLATKMHQRSSVRPGVRLRSIHRRSLQSKTPLSYWNCWCRVRDLNPRPTVYKTAALPLS